MTNETSHYIHGTDPQEQSRLTLMNSVINEAAIREMNLQQGDRVLDVGSGLAQLTRIMAKQVGDQGYVLGIERDEKQITEAKLQAERDSETHLVEMRQGDARQLPLEESEWNSFDIVHCRFVLEHLPDPLVAVKQMFAAAKPGGRIILQDDDHELLRVWPPCEEGTNLWQTYIDSYAPVGNDAIVGRKLISIMHQAGAAPLRNTWLFYGACAGQEIFDPLLDNLLGVLGGASETLIRNNLMTQVQIDSGISALQAWRKLPDAALWYAINYAEARKPV